MPFFHRVLQLFNFFNFLTHRGGGTGGVEEEAGTCMTENGVVNKTARTGFGTKKIAFVTCQKVKKS